VGFRLVDRRANSEAWRLLIEDYLPLHDYAAHSILELEWLARLPQVLPPERLVSSQAYASRLHEVRLSTFGFEMGWRYFSLFRPFLDEEPHLRRSLDSYWCFLDLDGSPRARGVDDDLDPTCPAGDVDYWVINFE